jgi:chemotaxis protein methyltransferase CheR/type IV pilus assembly protein PilK
MSALANWSMKNMPAMDAEQFRLWQTLLEERIGMSLGQERKLFLESSLSVRMRELGLENYADYYAHLRAGTTESRAMEWSILVDRLTVQETSFFRHPDSYVLVEELVQRFIHEHAKSEVFNVWSVGCSTGEEPYSLAMLIEEQFHQAGWSGYFGITATDISLPTLSKARHAKYGVRKVERIDPALREKYFERLNEQEYQVKNELRQRVCFARLNVLDLKQAPISGMHLIFCQNMLIYFRRWRKREIVSKLVERLLPGGILIIGPGELTDWHHPEMERVYFGEALAYRRLNDGTQEAKKGDKQKGKA